MLTFDTQGQAVLLTTEAAEPGEFIEPISRWIRQRERIGKCIAATCAGCARLTYVVPTSSPAPAECSDCAHRRELAARPLRERWFDSVASWFVWWVLAALVLPIGALAMLPATPWLDEWNGWLATLAFVILAPLPFAVGYLLPDRKSPASPSGPRGAEPPRQAVPLRNRRKRKR